MMDRQTGDKRLIVSATSRFRMAADAMPVAAGNTLAYSPRFEPRELTIRGQIE